MFLRTRDRKISFKPTEKISAEEWEDIKNRYSIAKKFLEKTNPILILLNENLKTNEDTILENRVREVKEVYSITDTFKKIFTTSKKLQDDEIVGQIKLVRFLLKEINSWIERKEILEMREAEGKTVIEKNEEKRG